MRVGPLYEQAVALSPRAARMAARLLVMETTLPEPLRRSLVIALGACAGCADEADDELDTRESVGRRVDREARAAARFVEACKASCAALSR
jgi:hypothetical protein